MSEAMREDDGVTLPPGPRAVQSAFAILREARTLAEAEWMGPDGRDAATKIVLCAESLLLDATALHEYVDVQEGNLRGMCEESLAAAREITALRRRLADAEQTVERVTIELATALDHFSAAFNELRKLPARLTGETPRPMGVMRDDDVKTMQRPRDAAKGV